MISCTQDFKTAFMSYGRQFKSSVTIGATTYDEENIVSITPAFECEMLTAGMRSLDIELFDVGSSIEKGVDVTATIQVASAGNWESLSFTDYIVHSYEYDNGQNTLHITCYDKMLLAMVDYDLDLTYPMTVSALLSAICARLGFTVGSLDFPNAATIIVRDKFSGLGYTFRDILTDIAQATGRTIVINGSTLELRDISPNIYTVTAENLRRISIGETFGPVNSIVLSRSPQEDNVYLRDESSVARNGLHEVRIVNNQISDDDRAAFLPALLYGLKGLEFSTYEIDTYGIPWLDVADGFVCIDLEGNSHYCACFQNSCTIGKGCTGSMFLEMPNAAETDYKAAGNAAEKSNRRTELKVDKAEGQITAIVSDVNTVNRKLNNIGGRNLIINTLEPRVSDDEGNQDPDLFPRIYQQLNYTKTRDWIATVAEHGIRLTKGTATGTILFNMGQTNPDDPQSSMNGLKAGKTYTMSFGLKSKMMSNDSGAAHWRYVFASWDINNVLTTQELYQPGITNGVEECFDMVSTFSIPSDAEKCCIQLRVAYDGTTTSPPASSHAASDFFELTNIKLEEGEVATAWTPAPEDESVLRENSISTQINIVAGNVQSIVDRVNALDDDIERRAQTVFEQNESSINITINDLLRDITGMDDIIENIRARFEFSVNGLKIKGTKGSTSGSYLNLASDEVALFVGNAKKLWLTAEGANADAFVANNYVSIGEFLWEVYPNGFRLRKR